MGTPAYMAPEQWVDAASAGPPADVYAAGIVLSELLEGEHPLVDLRAGQGELPGGRRMPAGSLASRVCSLPRRSIAAIGSPRYRRHWRHC